MHYFAYGSNLSVARLRARTPSAVPLGCHRLAGHDLRFHKVGVDGSGKCDAFATSDPRDLIYGVVFEIAPDEKAALDQIEGLGFGYREQEVTVIGPGDTPRRALTYIATLIDDTLLPFSWYMAHVLAGARENRLPEHYIESKMLRLPVIEDGDRERDARERAVHL